VDRPVSSPFGDSTASMIVLSGVEGDTPGQLRERAIKWMQENVVQSAVNLTTGLVTVTVTTDWPAVSGAISKSIVEEINLFLGASRRSRASEERGFIEAQLERARDELRQVEDSAKRFLLANRQYQNSPELRFEFERLQRELVLRQQLFSTLSVSLQQARINEVRDTPVITVVEQPYVPPTPDRRSLPLIVILGAAAGSFLGLLWALATAAGSAGSRQDPESFVVVQEFIAGIKRRDWRFVLFGRRPSAS
jgi:tyrosine-protein kinase Etk/Wzc